MARIRTIKPETPQSESFGRLSRDARLCFILLWTICDDAGRARASSRLLASLLYPYDDGEDGHIKTTGADIERWLTELEGEGCIRRYEIDGDQYIELPKWLKHQKIDKPTPSRLPEFREASRIVASVPEFPARDLGPVPRTLDHNTAPSADEVFGKRFDEEFWTAYPSRGQAGNPRKPARAKFIAACKRGEDPEAIIAGARAYASNPTTKVGTEFVKTAEVWLSKECWKDQPTPVAEPIPFTQNEDTQWRARVLAWMQSPKHPDDRYWNSGEWGPAPHHLDTRVPRRILDETGACNELPPCLDKRSKLTEVA